MVAGFYDSMIRGQANSGATQPRALGPTGLSAEDGACDGAEHARAAEHACAVGRMLFVNGQSYWTICAYRN